jgi:protein-S-isoprenylcysteine O-methyltransferase Ste14
MRTLGVNISSIHEDRELIITGPYKYVRHPLYTLFIAMAVDLWLILPNWLLLIGIPMTVIAGKIRANYEEKILIDQYGEQYLEYKKNTGQLLPKLW